MQPRSFSKPPTVGLGVLSWRARKTLRASLESFRRGDLFSCFDETLIFFQEIEEEDREIARQFGPRAAGVETNIGIMGGMKRVAELLHTDYVLHLENDLHLIADMQTVRRKITDAIANMESGAARCYRMDERRPPAGDAGELRKYMRYHPAPLLHRRDNWLRRLRRIARPFKARQMSGAAVYCHDRPHVRFPQHIRPLRGGDWSVDSAAMNWSNRAPLYPRKWFLDEIIPYAEAHPSARTVNGGQDLEKELNRRWWRERRFRVGVCGEGLFVHKRLDRPAGDEKSGTVG
ncbi:MAG: hypothetical protein ACR2QC_00555 [Gammaproteobacteria bacterium]